MLNSGTYKEEIFNALMEPLLRERNLKLKLVFYGPLIDRFVFLGVLMEIFTLGMKTILLVLLSRDILER